MLVPLVPTDVALWSVIVVFISGLATTVILVLRALTTGKIVVGRHYEDALKREASWRSAAETAMATNSELAGQVGRLTAATEQSTAAMREALLMLRTPPDRPDRSAV